MIPKGWEVRNLSDIAEIKRGAGSQYLNYVDNPTDGIRLIRISDFLGDNPKYIERTTEINRFLLQEGDLLIAGTGATAGITFEVPDTLVGLAFSYNAPRIRVQKEFEKSFVLYYLKSSEILRQQHALFTGNAQPFLDTKAIGGFKIALPPLSEQKKIAQILSTWDKAIETVQKLIANSQQKKKALMQQLLTGKKRFPEFDGEWKQVRLVDVLNGKKRKGKIVPTNENQSGMAYIGSTSFEGNFGIYTDSSDAVTCLPNDILVLWDGENAGKVATGLKGAVSSTVVRYCIDESKADNRFITYNLLRDNYKVRAIREGSGIPHMPGDFEQWYRIDLPPLDEQQKIASILSSADQEIETWKQELAHLKQEKKALMQQLLTGKRRVKVD